MFGDTSDMKTSIEAVQGTGEEISRYAGTRPNDKFLLVVIDEAKPAEIFDEAKWEETVRRIESMSGLFRELPDEAYSTAALYE